MIEKITNSTDLKKEQEAYAKYKALASDAFLLVPRLLDFNG
jgi:hypothetical protein